MEHYIYKITNNINGKFYYGKRSCECLAIDDSYMGSGSHLKSAIKKYGKENFTKEILAYCDSFEDAYELEEMVVTEEEVNNPMCYNLCVGGFGGVGYNRGKPSWNKGLKGYGSGRVISDNERINRSKAQKGRVVSEETKARISQTQTGKKRGKHHEESGKNISESLKKLDKVTCPHCGKSGSPTGMYSWHFDYCKLKLNYKERGK